MEGRAFIGIFRHLWLKFLDAVNFGANSVWICEKEPLRADQKIEFLVNYITEI